MQKKEVDIIRVAAAMNFSKKIGLSFVLLTFLTLVTGCIGLLFIYRVLAAFGAVSVGSDSPGVDLTGLDRYVHRSVLLSREISHDKEIDDILELRKEFVQTVEEFDRSFNRIRRGIEDEMYLGTLKRFKEEQNELQEKTHELIEAIIEELRAESLYRRALSESEQGWQQIVLSLRRATESLTGASGIHYQSGIPRADQRSGEQGRPTIVSASWLPSLVRAQQLLMEMRLRLKEYLALEEVERLGSVAGQIEMLYRDIVVVLAYIETAAAVELPEPSLTAVVRATRAWAGSLLGQEGLLDLYRQGLILKTKTDALTGKMRNETEDTLQMLDSVIGLGSRLYGGERDRGFVTAAPTLLILAISVATLLSVALAVVLTHAITRPVRKLISVTEAVRSGDYSRRLDIKSGDELASLGDAFNRMVEQVQRSQEEIRDLNANLERRVSERTGELEEEIRQRERAEREMRQKQEQLIQAGKLASLGVLVAGVAHEINNPNQAIMMGSQLLRKAWPDMRTVLDEFYERKGDFLIGGINYSELRENLVEHFNGIVKSARRIDTIVQGLKDFARQDHPEMTQIVNLNLVVKSALILLDNMLKKSTDNLTVQLSARIPTFRGNAQRVEQVVINLVQNACQSLKERSRGIAISTSRFDTENWVVLTIRDEGQGIPQENLNRIRDPFFTTKREGGGTGLGLSVTSTIVKEHGGDLEFFSEEGKGTTVRVRFPAHADRRVI